jgi:hypothetical protein
LHEIISAQGVRLSSLSPYVIAGPVPEHMFFGREAQVKEIKLNVSKTSYAVVGGRRIGKSSILHKVTRLLEESGCAATYINCEDKKEPEQFLKALHTSLGASDAETFREYVSSRQQQNGGPPVFLLDEFDALLRADCEKNMGRLTRTFRALSHEGRCHFVFSGSRTLNSHLSNSASPFFNFCHDIVLGPLDAVSVAKMVRDPMEQLCVEMVDQTRSINLIVDITSCHPHLAQWICHMLLQKCTERRVTPSDLEAITSEAAFFRRYVQTAWGESELEPLERLITLVMPERGSGLDEIFSSIAEHVTISTEAVRESLKMLQLGGLVKGTDDHYEFGMSHFPQIVRRYENVSAQIHACVEALR